MIASLVGYALDSVGADPRSQQPIAIPAGETGSISIAVKHRDGTAFDLSGCQLLLTVERSSIVVISRQATIDSTSLGTAHFPLVVADTLTLKNSYLYDVWLTLADGSRYQVVEASSWSVMAAEGQPGQVVTTPSSQTPLGLGPIGPTGPSGPTGPAGPATLWTPTVYTTATLPAPASVAIRTVIVNSDTNQILITYDNLTWSALS